LRLTQTLQPVGAPILISSSAATGVQVTSNGDSYFLVWDEHAASGNIGSVRGARVSASGQVLDPTSIVIDPNVGVSQSFPDATWNGTSWSVAYDSGYNQVTGGYGNHDIYLRRVSSGGAVLDGAPVVVSAAGSHQLAPAIAPVGNGAVPGSLA
jgi:hypothetical protein